ncbi:MAG: hypothetical protein ACOYNR_16425 [Blastocatellia bacterium]
MLNRTPRRSLPLLLLLALFFSVGCARLTPRTTALREIHQTYRTEFDQYLQLTVPAPALNGDVSGVGVAPGQAPFAATLREIRGYRIRYGETAREASHLTVLEGMIYLQSGQLGLARLLLPDLRRAADNLGQGSGAAVRDQLLARNFEPLLEGWSALREPETRDSARRLAAAAAAIGAQLATLARSSPSQTSEPEVDEGAIYLATSGAIFYAWVGKILSFQARQDRPCWCEKGRSLIEPHLSESERRLSSGIDFQSIPAGRIRYLAWYRSLALCAGERPPADCEGRLQ